MEAQFCFINNPLGIPHFVGIWDRILKAVKTLVELTLEDWSVSKRIKLETNIHQIIMFDGLFLPGS